MGKYNFDEVIDRVGTGCIKYEQQDAFGVSKGLLPFWVADSDFATLPDIIEAMRRRLQHPLLGYSFVEEPCISAIQNWFKTRHNLAVASTAIEMTTGVVTALRVVLLTVTNPCDEVLVFTPVYDPFYRIIKNTGRTLVDCPLTPENNTYSIDFTLLETQLKSGVKAVIFCNPHNPVGRVWTQQEVEQLAGLCEKYGAFLLSDEIHADFGLFGNKYYSSGRAAQNQDRTAVFTAISKTFNTAGLNSSSIFVSNPQLKEKIGKSLNDACIATNGMAYSAIQAAYTHGAQWVDEQNEYLTKNVIFAREFFTQNMPDVGVTNIEGTYLLWLDFTCYGLSSRQLSKLFAEYGVALSVGSNYGAKGEGFMRLNIACPKSILEKGLHQLYQLHKDRGAVVAR